MCAFFLRLLFSFCFVFFFFLSVLSVVFCLLNCKLYIKIMAFSFNFALRKQKTENVGERRRARWLAWCLCAVAVHKSTRIIRQRLHVHERSIEIRVCAAYVFCVCVADGERWCRRHCCALIMFRSVCVCSVCFECIHGMTVCTHSHRLLLPLGIFCFVFCFSFFCVCFFE